MLELFPNLRPQNHRRVAPDAGGLTSLDRRSISYGEVLGMLLSAMYVMSTAYESDGARDGQGGGEI